MPSIRYPLFPLPTLAHPRFCTTILALCSHKSCHPLLLPNDFVMTWFYHEFLNSFFSSTVLLTVPLTLPLTTPFSTARSVCWKISLSNLTTMLSVFRLLALSNLSKIHTRLLLVTGKTAKPQSKCSRCQTCTRQSWFLQFSSLDAIWSCIWKLAPRRGEKSLCNCLGGPRCCIKVLWEGIFLALLWQRAHRW